MKTYRHVRTKYGLEWDFTVSETEDKAERRINPLLMIAVVLPMVLAFLQYCV